MTKKEIKALREELSIHFKNSPDELDFLEVFINELIESRDRTFTKSYQEDLVRLNKSLNKTCEDKVEEAFKVADKRTKKLLKLQIMVIKKLLIEKAIATVGSTATKTMLGDDLIVFRGS